MIGPTPESFAQTIRELQENLKTVEAERLKDGLTILKLSQDKRELTGKLHALEKIAREGLSYYNGEAFTNSFQAIAIEYLKKIDELMGK